MKLKKFISECRENEVFKNLSIYIVSSWVLLQVIALIAEPLGLPSSSLTYLLLFLLIGFPVYVYLLWWFQLKNTVKKKPLLDKSGNPVPGKFVMGPFQKIYFSSLSIISIIAVGVALVVVEQNFVREAGLPDIETGDKIAVLNFDNNTGDENLDITGKMTSDWIIHGITQNKLGQVISPEIIDDYSKVLRASILSSNEQNSTVTDYLKPSKIIEGEYYLHKDKLLFQCSITDEIMNTTLISFEPVECDVSSPLDCIESLKQRILGYLATEDKDIATLEEKPPSFEAYKYFYDAKLQYLKAPHDTVSLGLFDKAIEADSTYFEPKVYKLLFHYNRGEFTTADSLLKPMFNAPGTSDRQQLLLRIYDALINGRSKPAHRYQQIEYNTSPFKLETNSNMMIMSLQLVNKPEEIDSVFAEINMEGWDITDCNFCVERYKIKGLADIQRKEYDQAIELLSGFANDSDVRYTVLKKILLRAYIRAEKYPLADDILTNIHLKSEERDWLDIHLFAAKELVWKGKQDLANIYLDKIVKYIEEEFSTTPSGLVHIMAESLFYSRDYGRAIEYLEKLLTTYPGLIDYHALLAIAYKQNGQTSKANKKLEDLEDLRANYQLGEVDYGLAVYYASILDENKTIKHLLRAIADGHWYETSTFQNDPLLRSYFETDSFKRILSFWH
ncbi:MAG: hypothetical protein WBM43_06185 [Flavobacteriaceae bacterium]